MRRARVAQKDQTMKMMRVMKKIVKERKVVKTRNKKRRKKEVKRKIIKRFGRKMEVKTFLILLKSLDQPRRSKGYIMHIHKKKRMEMKIIKKCKWLSEKK